MTTADLTSALEEVPDELLDAEHRSAREDALAALETLSQLTFDPTVLVVIGGGGSGKSSVVNVLVGADVASVSAIRPTTVDVSMIGRSGPAAMEGAVEYVFTDHLRDGIVVVDTPSWDHEPDVVRATVARAHTVVVVLTPARYGDAVASDIVRGLPDNAKLALVANRMPTDADDNDDVLDDIEATFGRSVFAHVIEGEPIELPGSLVADLPVDTGFIDVKRSHESSAAHLGRSIARSVSSSAAELSQVMRVLGDTATPSLEADIEVRGDDWARAKEGLVDLASAAAIAFDDAIVVGSPNDLSVRIRESIQMPEMADLPTAIEDWRIEAAETFRRRSEVRWRRKSAFELLDRWSWKIGVDTETKPPRRVTRVMHGAFEATARETRAKLVALLDATVSSRRSQWTDIAEHIGEYRPGVLFAASDALDGGESTNE